MGSVWIILYPQHKALCLVHKRDSENVNYINERMNRHSPFYPPPTKKGGEIKCIGSNKENEKIFKLPNFKTREDFKYDLNHILRVWLYHCLMFLYTSISSPGK